MPALLTRMSMRPWRSTVAAIIASMAAASVTSTEATSALPPFSWIAVTVSHAWSPRAAATTCAPRATRSAAISRPMPRDAPVTIATLSDRSNMEYGFEVLGCGEGEHLRLPVNLLDEAAKHTPRPHLNIRGDARGRKILDDPLPQHRSRHLTNQRVDR